MTPQALAQLAFGALSAHRVRTRLTVAAVAIGVAAVLLLTSLGQSARNYVLDQFAGMGSNLLVVLPGHVETAGAGAMFSGGTTKPLTVEDAEALAHQVRGVTTFVPIAMGAATVSAGSLERATVILGGTDQFASVRGMTVRVGRNLPAMDPRAPAQVAVLGHKAAQELFPDGNPLGAPIRVGDARFRVIGVFAPVGQQLGSDFDDMVLVPVASAQRLVNREGLFRIILRLRSVEQLERAERDVRRLLIERHQVEDFTIVTPKAVMASLGDILGALTGALAAIAAISLGVAGVGVMNVMLISVAERTPEVGLFKAVGASRTQVLAIFLTEAALLSLSGGIVGVAVGWTGAQMVGLLAPSFPVTTPLWAIEAALGVSIVVGVVFGALPAARAARVPPVDALAGRV